MVELGAVVLRSGSPEHQVALVHIATNSIHCHWVQGPPASLQYLHCVACDATFDLDHWSACPDPAVARSRFELRDAIVDVLQQLDSADPWLRLHCRLPLEDLLLELFPLLAAAHVAEIDPSLYRQRHVTLCMIGAFSATEASLAIRRIGLASGKPDGQAAMRDIRLLCVDSIRQLYDSLKARLS